MTTLFHFRHTRSIPDLILLSAGCLCDNRLSSLSVFAVDKAHFLSLSFSFLFLHYCPLSRFPMSARNNGPAGKFRIEASWNEAHGTYRANGKSDRL